MRGKIKQKRISFYEFGRDLLKTWTVARDGKDRGDDENYTFDILVARGRDREFAIVSDCFIYIAEPCLVIPPRNGAITRLFADESTRAMSRLTLLTSRPVAM